MDKIVKIEKNSSEEELIQPLFDRVVGVNNWPDFFDDPYCSQIMNLIDYDFAELEAKKDSRSAKNAGLYSCCIQNAIATEIKKYLEEHPRASVVTLECKLDTTSLIVDNGMCRIYNLDNFKFIQVREKLLPSSKREKNQPINIKERLWYDKVDYNPEDGAIFVITDAFVYWKEEDVRRFINEMSKRFRGATFVFDSLDKDGRDTKLSSMKKIGIDIKDNFYLDNPKKKLATYSRFLESIESKPLYSAYKNPEWKVGIGLKLAMKALDITSINVLKFKDPEVY